MSESYKVFNTSHGPATFTIFLPQGDVESMPRHKARKALGRSMVPVTIKAQHWKDLVKETGLTVSELKQQTELNRLMYSKRPVLVHITLEEDKVVKALDPKPEPKKEEVAESKEEKASEETSEETTEEKAPEETKEEESAPALAIPPDLGAAPPAANLSGLAAAMGAPPAAGRKGRKG